MRKIVLLLLLSWVVATVQAQLQTEQQTIIWPEQGGKGDLSIKPGESFVQWVEFAKTEDPVRRTLRVVGGGEMPGRFAARGETFFREQEYLIDDNLDSIEIQRDLHSLYFKGEGDPFERHAYNRLTLPEADATTDITVEIAHKRKNLKIAPGGDFGVELQVYKRKEGRHPEDVYDTADTVIYIPVPEGSGGFRVLKQGVTLPAGTASILIRVGGTNFSGECWVEAPRVIVDDKTLFHSPFIPNARRGDDHNYWVGINLATRSWPRWRVEFGGKTIFEGYVFDRASNIADFYIPFPVGVAGEGELKLTLVPEPHRTPFAYRLRSVQLLEESAREVEIVSVPKFITRGEKSAVLLEINDPPAEITVEAGEGIEVLEPRLSSPAIGLYAVEIRATATGCDIPVTVMYGVRILTAHIGQVVEKEPDGVYLSSGDEVHIDNTVRDYDRFFKWYVAERLGNWYQFRPSYQWSGVRYTGDDFVKHYTGLLNKLQMPYAWQVEGRTLAASRINPSLDALASPMFRGKQAHENDGGYYYWQHFKYQGLHSDMAARTRPYGGIFAKHRPIHTDHGTFIHYDPRETKDMADGARRFVANLASSRGESTRHTGPSTMFRYLYQAGYDWLGAEQMYGPEDIIMSSLRGASRAYGKDDFGSLHAVQWGSGPFTDPRHSLRFYLSLAVAYIHGSSHINTEEGLWTDEYANDRYTEAGRQHMMAQHLMLDYIETHSRRGEMTTPIAVIQGRNDAWKSFGRTSLWSQDGDEWGFNKAAESFDLLKIFYPESSVGYASTDGLFTTTPYGPVDLLPVEAQEKAMSRYKALIFLGWNSFDGADFVRIGKFVERGGTVILTAAHLNAELWPAEPVRFPEDDTVIRTLLGEDYKTYTTRTVIPFGKGYFIYYPQGVYPADNAIREEYTADIHALSAKLTDAEKAGLGWIESSSHIDFTVWDSDTFRTFYLLNVDWKSGSAAHPATLRIGGSEFTFDVPTYALTTIRSAHGIAATTGGNTSDILAIENRNGELWVTCQSTGPDILTIFNGITGRQTTIPIASAGINAIAIDTDQ